MFQKTWFWAMNAGVQQKGRDNNSAEETWVYAAARSPARQLLGQLFEVPAKPIQQTKVNPHEKSPVNLHVFLIHCRRILALALPSLLLSLLVRWRCRRGWRVINRSRGTTSGWNARDPCGGRGEA